MSELNAPFFEQANRRQTSFVTPVTFDVLVGATSTTIYTGVAGQSFLIRALAAVDDTASPVTLTINVGANEWFDDSIAADSTVRISALEGMLIPPSTNITATGNTLRVIGWGLRIAGGDAWVL